MEIFQSVLPVVTAFIGGWFAYFIQNKSLARSRNWLLEDEFRKTSLEKGEELYSLIDRWNNAAGSSFFLYRKVMLGELDYNQALDGVIENGVRNTENFERIGLLVSVYFPEIENEFLAIRAVIFQAGRIEADFRANYKLGVFDASGHLPAYENSMLESERLTEAFQKTLASILRKRAGALLGAN